MRHSCQLQSLHTYKYEDTVLSKAADDMETSAFSDNLVVSKPADLYDFDIGELWDNIWK